MPKMPMKTVLPSERAKRLHHDVASFMAESLKKDDMPTEHVLAVLSYMVGQTIALMDRTKFTREMAIAIVQNNLELGNQHAIEDVVGKPQGRVQ